MFWLFWLIAIWAERREEVFDEREIRNGDVRVVVGYRKGDAFVLTIKCSFGAWLDVRVVGTWEAACRELVEAGMQPPPVNTSWRSMEWQTLLREQYDAGRGPMAAQPGHSDHQAGTALDLATSPAREYIRANAKRLGFSFNVPSEPWHCVIVKESV